ncbi:MAG TPA: hypothetical protein VKJ47_11355 [Candidatus Binatia bacterium]|nr:hypothetical protein [Candidatus Binatia bacterium]
MSLKTMPLYATLWREFYERSTIVYFMARPEGESNFRDVVSLMEISRVFPHGLTQVRFCPVIPGVTTLESPAPGEGIIILGRPEHFRSEFIQERIIDNLYPPLRLSFKSNDPKKPGYRTVHCALTGKDYNAPNDRDDPSQLRLEDYALVYLGQARPYESEESAPCLILSGTSTLGTWGATVFTTSPYLLQRHVGYSPWFQGVLSVALRLPARGAPFLRPHLTLQVTDSFFRACWMRVVYQARAAEREWRKNVDFQVFVNDHQVAAGFDTWRCVIALALEQQERPNQDIQLREIENRLRQSFAPAALLNNSLNLTDCLKRVFAQLRHHGVYAERTPTGYQLFLAGFEETVA